MRDIQFVLEKLLLWGRVPVMIADWQEKVIYSDRQLLDEEKWWKENPDLVESLVSDLGEKRHKIFLEKDNFAYAAVLDIKEELCCMIGPILMKDVFYGALGNYRNLGDVMKPEVHLPVWTLERLIACVQLLHFSIYHEQLEYESLLNECIDFPEKYKVKEKEIFAYEIRNAEENKIPLPYQVEQRWVSALKEGHKIEMDSLDAMSRAGEMAKSSKKQMEYNTVVAITIAARAAIEGGVPPMRALRLADVYLQKLEQCTDELRMRSINNNAVDAFLLAVQEAKKEGKDEPFYIRTCKDYISRHRTGHICLEKMAEELKINYSYLSRKFKEMEGMTIQQYVIREKVRAAANMIRFSDLSLTEIALYLDFSSQSHMGSCFKKEYGMTPNEYRKKYSY